MGQPKPIIAWPGGKRRLAGKILPRFPKHECYVEAFAGGAALFFCKTPSKTEVLNDIHGELINLYRVTKAHLNEFLKQFDGLLSSREMFARLQATPPETLTDIQRAARFYYLQKLAFGGKVASQTFGTATTSPPRFNPLTIKRDLAAAHQRLARTCIEHLPWQECVARYDRPTTLFYLDPPYWGTQGYGVEFGLDQYTAMATMAKTIKGKMLISVNDIPEMREAFAELRIDTLETTYTIGSAANASRSEVRKELLISNFD